MKTCAACLATAPDAATSCLLCGEASWKPRERPEPIPPPAPSPPMQAPFNYTRKRGR